MKRLTLWWQTRQTRERRLLAIAITILSLSLMYSVWQQALDWREQKRVALMQETQALQLFSELENALVKHYSSLLRTPPDAAEIIGMASKLGIQLDIAEMQNGFRLNAPAETAFQPMMTWLAQLEACCALHARTLHLELRDQHSVLTELELTHGQ